MEDIPGIKAYRKAFKQAVEDQKKILNNELPDQAKNVIDAMEECLEQSQCASLYVLDNGIGLNPDRMKGLLADGLSVKAGSSTGAVGNGHLTALPASDLRYVLYGGRYKSEDKPEKTICAGHAVLASHRKKNKRMSKDGYFVSSLQDDFYDPYRFIEGTGIPGYIRDRLDWIHTNWEPGLGTVVAIPAFNNFREGNRSLWEMVSRAAACNFFAAFARGELKIEVAEKGRTETVDHSNIRRILREVKDQKRARGKFLSGSRAWSAYETIEKGELHTVPTACGDLSLMLLYGDEARNVGIDTSRIDLCRNGMWVADDLPKLQLRRFSEMQPFHCVILLQAEDGEIHRLVRKSEGPLHNELKARKWLKPGEKKNLETALEMVYETLKGLLPAFQMESYRIDEILSVDVQGTSKGGRRSRTATVNSFARLPRLSAARRALGNERQVTAGEGPGQGERTDTEGTGGKGLGGGGGDSSRKRGSPLAFVGTPALVGNRTCIFEMVPQQACRYAEVRFAVDENRDETWEMHGMDRFVNLKKVRINEQGVSEDQLIIDGHKNCLGVSLEDLKEDQTVLLEFEFTLPAGATLPDNVPVALEPQFTRQIRTAPVQEGE